MKSKIKLLGGCIALIVIMLFTGCSQSDQNKITKLIKEYAKTNIADYKSFEIISLDSISEIYSDFLQEPELQKQFQQYCYYNLCVDNENRNIQKIDNYLDDCQRKLELLKKQCERNEMDYLLRPSYRGDLYDYTSSQYDVYANAKQLAKYADEAEAQKRKAQKVIRCYNDSLDIVYQMTSDFYKNYKPIYLGRGTLLKCRFRGDDGNMQIESYDILFDSELTVLLSAKNIKGKSSNETIKDYVNHAIAQNDAAKRKNNSSKTKNNAVKSKDNSSKIKSNSAPKNKGADDKNNENVASSDGVFKTVEEMPEFPGGTAKLLEYIGKNIKYPTRARESDIQGKVFVQFVVEPDGSISKVQVLRGIGGGCDEEAVRVLQSMPKWKPGKQRGTPVRVQYMVPVVFKLQ